MKKKGYNGHTGLRREKSCKYLGGKRQKLLWSLAKSERERGKFENFFEKVFWISQTLFLKKLDSRCSIDRKTSLINRTKQRLTGIFKKDFDWLKIRLDQSKFWKNGFLEKITWFLKTYLKALNIRNKNARVWDEMLFQNTSFKPNFSKI